MSFWKWFRTHIRWPKSYKVIEIEKSQRISAGRSDKELQESVSTLQSHPGFLYLLRRLEAQNAALKAKLCGERHDDLKDVQFIQAGIFWSEWLRREVSAATTRSTETKVDPFDDELRAFREIDKLIERVGAD